MKISDVIFRVPSENQSVLSFQQKLDNWVRDAYEVGRFDIARVLREYSRGDELSLNNYESESLPDVFNDRKFANLKTLGSSYKCVPLLMKMV